MFFKDKLLQLILSHPHSKLPEVQSISSFTFRKPGTSLIIWPVNQITITLPLFLFHQPANLPDSLSMHFYSFSFSHFHPVTLTCFSSFFYRAQLISCLDLPSVWLNLLSSSFTFFLFSSPSRSFSCYGSKSLSLVARLSQHDIHSVHCTLDKALKSLVGSKWMIN